MKKYFFIAVFFIANTFNAISQSTSEKKDSLKIDSLKKMLPNLKKIDRIEAMIFVCEYYSDRTKARNINALDSIRIYGNKILNESKAISYKRGIAMGLMRTSPDSLKEKRAQEAMQIGKEIGDEEIMGWATEITNTLNTLSDNEQTIANEAEAIDHFNKAGKILRAAYLNTWLCQTYFGQGKNEKAFDCARQNIETLKKIQSPEFSYIYKECWLWAFWNMAYIFKAAGDYEEAIKYIHKTEEIDKADDPKAEDWSLDIIAFYIELGRYDSAHFYWNHFTSLPNWNDPNWGWRPGKKLTLNGLAQIYAMNKQYDTAIAILKGNLIYFDSLSKYTTGNYHHAGDYGKMIASIALGAIYDSLKNYNASLQYAKDGFSHAYFMNSRPELMQACQILSRAYHHLNNNDSAYIYLEKYVTLKDSIQSKQFLLRIYNSKKEAEDETRKAQLGFLMKDNKIKQEQLKQEAMLKNFLIMFLLVLFIAGIFIFRNLNLKRRNDRLKSGKQQAEFQEKAIRLEMQALRAQMNPHFIFNCLSSINCFILVNDTEKASDYLTRFSRLIRMVLNNSEKSMITLEEELKMLGLYLDMERLRFENSFDYNITYTNDVDAASVLIPPLLLQPFCENAIWHGLMHKDGQGHLNITISKEKDFLNCIITDDGVGKAKAGALNSLSAKKEKSMGLKITAERLSLFNGEKEMDHFYEMDDVLNETGHIAGTKVSVKIKHKDLMEAVA
jgi:tetratricopeptide (TPR) repeat protein